jgi:5-carboxymethyl-2-hydroxymuconate isomerase
MPHVIIEYSENVPALANPAELTQIAHSTMMESGLFNAADVKSRATAAEHYLVGEKGTDGSFVHVTVYLLEGRNLLQKQRLSEALRDALQLPLQKVSQLSVDIRELQKDVYRKYVSE